MIPTELLTMGGSFLMSSAVSIINTRMKAKARANELLIASSKASGKLVKEAREYENKGFQWTRRTIALLAVGSIIVLPKIVCLIHPETNVWVSWSEMTGGFWPFSDPKSELIWKQMTGILITPLDTHLVAAVTGLYFGKVK